MNCTECGNTGFVRVEKGPAGATYTVLAKCKCQPAEITIPRAQHEALMAAAKALKQSKSPLMDIAYRLNWALEDLRAAGIDLEEKT